jgi:hypothetical protein
MVESNIGQRLNQLLGYVVDSVHVVGHARLDLDLESPFLNVITGAVHNQIF